MKKKDFLVNKNSKQSKQSLLKQLKKHLLGATTVAATFFIAGNLNAQKLKVDPDFNQLLQERHKITDVKTQQHINKKIGLQTLSSKSTPSSLQDIKYESIIYTKDAQNLKDKGIQVNSVYPNFVTANITLDQLENLNADSKVDFIKTATIFYPDNDISNADSGASLLHEGKLNNTIYKGKGVLVGIYDTGIDWSHPDFRDPDDQTKSRILKIWDMTITPQGNETTPKGFTYGVEYTKAHIDDELDGTPANFVREVDNYGHGTHVAGTAAGNGSARADKKYQGLAPEADIIVIKGTDDTFPETRTIDAFTYFSKVATELGRPIAVNMSLGGLSGGHDGTTPTDVAADTFASSAPGRVIVISAGNSGGRNLHKMTTINPGETQTITYSIPSTSSTTSTEIFRTYNYSSDNENQTVVATAPTGEKYSVDFKTYTNTNTPDGNYNFYVQSTVGTDNNKSIAYLRVSRNPRADKIAVPAGKWTLSVTNNGPNIQTLHGWLMIHSSSPVTPTVTGGDNNYMVGSPGNSTNAITVANYVGRYSWTSNYMTASGTPPVYTPATGYYTANGATQDSYSASTSWGPRVDGYQKPDIAASGQNVISALAKGTLATTSSDNIDLQYYRKNQGTSMSAPAVTGAAALLLQAQPNFTYKEVKEAITKNAIVDNATGTVPNNIYGYGKLDIYKAIASTLQCEAPNTKISKYEGPYTSAQDAGATMNGNKVSVRFTPDITGKLGGVYFAASSTAISGTTFVVEIRNVDATGKPSSVIATKNFASSSIIPFSWNYVDVSDLNVNVSYGKDYAVSINLEGAATPNWGLRYQTTPTNGQFANRSSMSYDGGNTWTLISSRDYRIRTKIYEDLPQVHNLVNASTTISSNIAPNTSNLFVTNCTTIAKVEANGASPLTGVTNAKVWVASSQPTNYVARHYEITPVDNATTATGKVTLYFTQAEFDAYNTVNSKKLPTGPTDTDGIANIIINKFPGTSSDGSGLPESYSGEQTQITPEAANIIWNATYNYWEVSFNTVGFSGFFVSTTNDVLGTTNVKATEVSIYPNPAKTNVTIQLGQNNKGKVAIYDLSGRVVKTSELTQGASEINVSNLPKGVYIFKIETGNKTITKKAIKE